MTDTKKMKERLQVELTLLESELATVGHKTATPGDWEAGMGEKDAAATEPDERADAIEQYEANTAILKQLEIRYNNTKRALEKIEKGTYGTCEVSGEPIEEERLEANPSARTCEKHMGDEKSLT